MFVVAPPRGTGRPGEAGMSELIARLVSDRDALRDNLGREVQELDSALHVARERVASLEQARRDDAERWRARSDFERREANAERERLASARAQLEAERAELETTRANIAAKTATRDAAQLQTAAALSSSVHAMQRTARLAPLVGDAAASAVAIDVLDSELAAAEALNQMLADAAVLSRRQCESAERYQNLLVSRLEELEEIFGAKMDATEAEAAGGAAALAEGVEALDGGGGAIVEAWRCAEVERGVVAARAAEACDASDARAADVVRRADALGAQLADARAEAAAAVAEVGAMARRGDDMTDTLAGAPVTSRSNLGHISAASRQRLAGARAEAEALRLAAAAWAAQFESMRAALADADGAVAIAVR